eukprot:5483671-Amphidinium_carterae.2
MGSACSEFEASWIEVYHRPSVLLEVQTDSTINDTATIQESMTSIGGTALHKGPHWRTDAQVKRVLLSTGEDGSNESATFSEAFVTNMEIAANATVNTTSSILTTLVDTVKEKGRAPRIKANTPPPIEAAAQAGCTTQSHSVLFNT